MDRMTSKHWMALSLLAGVAIGFYFCGSLAPYSAIPGQLYQSGLSAAS
jgi:hypothetical protein